jgi:uncharacterized Fe-S cluster-containing protein
VEEDMCINCGICVKQCPQRAKRIKGGIDSVRELLAGKYRVIASIAPSFGALFPRPLSEVTSKLLSLGFYHVEETAVAAEVVAKEYRRRIEFLKDGDFLISSTCSAVKSMIEKYYPPLIPKLAPIISPMAAHGHMLKKTFGIDSKVVFICPCIAKKEEALDPQVYGAVDEVITFTELYDLIDESAVLSEPLKKGNTIEPLRPVTGRWFPLTGGILTTAGMNVDLNKGDFLLVDGIEETMAILSDLEQGRISPKFVEILACKGGCIGGPASKRDDSLFIKRDRMLKFAAEKGSESEALPYNGEISLQRSFKPSIVLSPNPGEKAILEILASIGKTTPDKELNCGSCGYSSCREKAIAVYKGMAELEMCLPYMRDKAENMANLIIDTTPNAIIVVDLNMIVKEFNNAAENIFGVKSFAIKGKSISTIMDDSIFYEAIGQNGCLRIKKEYPRLSLVVMATLLHIEEQNLILAIFTNITESERQKQGFELVKQETLLKAQEVINKQMRVAQEIAGILGETTAESKVLLKKLINIVETGGGNDVL